MTLGPVDLLITGGLVALPQGAVPASIAIVGEKISAVIPAADGVQLPQAASTIDATGKDVLPGIIDAHVHFRTESAHADTFQTASASAAYGGVTTIIPFVLGGDETSLPDHLTRWRLEGERESVVDFALHAQFQPGSRWLHEVPAAVEMGCRTVKLMLGYKKRGLMVTDDYLLAAMQNIASAGAMLMLHCENGEICDLLEDRLAAEGRTAPEYFHASRPVLAEVEATRRALAYAEVTGCPLYVVHLTVSEGLEAIRQAKANGLPVWTETCPQYLLLTDAEMKRQGPLTKIGPPLRHPEHLAAMWAGVADGSIDVIASDHAPHTPQAKSPGWENIFAAPFGMAGTETLLPLVYSEGVAKRGLGLAWLAKVMSENPARIFGLYPRKGAIQAGADADLVIVDPERRRTLGAEQLHSAAGYTAFAGWEVHGWPVMTLVRGRVVLQDGELCQPPGYGRFLPAGPVGHPQPAIGG